MKPKASDVEADKVFFSQKKQQLATKKKMPHNLHLFCIFLFRFTTIINLSCQEDLTAWSTSPCREAATDNRFVTRSKLPSDGVWDVELHNLGSGDVETEVPGFDVNDK